MGDFIISDNILEKYTGAGGDVIIPDGVEEIAEECADYTEEQWEDVAEEFELLVKKAEKYQDLTTEDKLELAKVQAKYAGLQAKKGIDKVIDGVKELFGGKKDK